MRGGWLDRELRYQRRRENSVNERLVSRETRQVHGLGTQARSEASITLIRRNRIARCGVGLANRAIEVQGPALRRRERPALGFAASSGTGFGLGSGLVWSWPLGPRLFGV